MTLAGFRASRLVLSAFLLAASPARAAAAKQTSPSAGTRNSVWSVGASGIRHTLKAGDGNHLLGTSSLVKLGRGYVSKTWFTNVSLDIISGPYQSPQQQRLTLDYTGTGLSAFWGYSAEASDLRSKEGNYGFALGLQYVDIVGRSVGERRSPSAVPGEADEIIDQFVMRVTNFSLVPAIFFSWLKDARPEGNRPELLTTRIEGYLLMIGFAMPVIANYNVSYAKQAGGPDGSRGQTSHVTTRGRLKGYSLVVSFTTLLGV